MDVVDNHVLWRAHPKQGSDRLRVTQKIPNENTGQPSDCS
jgi:hypothetical protein